MGGGPDDDRPVAGVEELYSRVPVAGVADRPELEGRVEFGTAEVHVADRRTLDRFVSLVGRDQWDFCYVVIPFDLEPLPHGHYRRIKIALTFAEPGVVAKYVTLAEENDDSLRDWHLTTWGIGRNRAVWELEATAADGWLRPRGHRLVCLVQRPRETTAADLVIEAEAAVVSTVVVRRERTATFRAPRSYRISFTDGKLHRLPLEEPDEWREPTARDEEAAGHVAIPASRLPTDPRRTVVVFHGRDRKARAGLFAFLDSLDLHPMEWSEMLQLVASGAPSISDVLNAALDVECVFLVFMTPDDMVYLRPEHAHGDDDPDTRPQGQARPNVLFEAGLAFARHPKQTVLAHLGEVRPVSDLLDRYRVRLDNSTESRQRLAQRLESAGCDVNTRGVRWHTAGDLTPPAADPRQR